MICIIVAIVLESQSALGLPWHSLQVGFGVDSLAVYRASRSELVYFNEMHIEAWSSINGPAVRGISIDSYLFAQVLVSCAQVCIYYG